MRFRAVVSLLAVAGCTVPTASGQSGEVRGPQAEATMDSIVLPVLPRPPRPLDFEEAKRALEHHIHVGTEGRVDVYCGCAYDEHKQVDFDRCASAHPYSPVEQHRARASRIEWEHVVPASWIGRTMPCWSDPGGHHRDHCRETSSDFAQAEGDMHNLLPSVGQINALRDDDSYGEVAGESHIAGCDFEIDESLHRVEPRDSVRGDLARATFYVSAVYRVPLRRSLYRTLVRWHRRDRPDALERSRNDAIERVQGNRNPYVDGRGALP